MKVIQHYSDSTFLDTTKVVTEQFQKSTYNIFIAPGSYIVSNAGTGNGGAATVNRGGGGGGGGTGDGGNGGSGQVVIRYLTADAAAFTITATGATSGTPTVNGAYSYFQYTSTGTLVVA